LQLGQNKKGVLYLYAEKEGNGMARPKTGSVFLRGKRWYVCYTIRGKRYQKATNARNKTEAQAILHKYMPQEYDYAERGKVGFSDYASSNEFLDALSSQECSCLVLDSRMPGLSGKALEEELKAVECTCRLSLLPLMMILKPDGKQRRCGL